MVANIPKAYKCISVLILVLNYSFTYSNQVTKDTVLVDKGIYLGPAISTVGIGVSVTRNISRHWDLRLNGSYLGYSYDVNKLDKDLQGNARLKVGAVGMNVDYYVLRFLYITGGIYYNFTSIDVQAEDAKSVNIGDIILEPKDIGIIKAKIAPGLKIEPYWGIGFNFRRAKKLNFGVEFGLFLIGPAKVKLGATGMLTPSANTAQEQIIENNISPLIYYPNISFRILYRIKR